MKKLAKVINQETKTCAVGTGTNTTKYRAMGFTELDVEQAYNGVWFLSGYAPEKPEPSKEEKLANIKQELATLDEKSARSMRAIIAGVGTEEDKEFLANLEEQAQKLREELGNYC